MPDTAPTPWREHTERLHRDLLDAGLDAGYRHGHRAGYLSGLLDGALLCLVVTVLLAGLAVALWGAAQ